MVAVVVILNVVVLARFVEWHVAVWGLALNAAVAVVAVTDVVVVAVTVVVVVVVAATVVVVVAAVVVQSYSDVWKRAHKPGVVDCLQLQRVAGFELLQI